MNIRTKLNKIVLGVGISALLLTTACGTKTKEGVAATVNGVDIPYTEFVKNYANQRNYYILSAGSDDFLTDKSQEDPSKTIDEYIKESVLNDLIDMEIIKQDAEKLGITVDETAVDTQLNSLKEQMGGEEAFAQALKSMGSNEEYYKEFIRNSSIMQQYYEKKQAEFTATDDEIQKYYDKNKGNYFTADAAHILVQDVNEANSIKKELDKGADFAEIAKEKSIDTGSGENGGELGEFSNSMMVTEFEDAVKAMKVGEISDPVASQFGYHIIKLNKFEVKPLDEVKDEISKTIVQQKMNDYLTKLSKDAKIEKYVDLKAAVEVPAEYQLPESALSSDETTTENSTNNSTETQETTN